jgi:hypothetical protein
MPAQTPDARRVARLPIPRQRPIQSDLRLRQVRLLELSAEVTAWHIGSTCELWQPSRSP